MLVPFKGMEVQFAKYIKNALPINSNLFINKANNVATFFLLLLRLLDKQPFIAAHKKSTENVGRNVGRTRHTHVDGSKGLNNSQRSVALYKFVWTEA